LTTCFPCARWFSFSKTSSRSLRLFFSRQRFSLTFWFVPRLLRTAKSFLFSFHNSSPRSRSLCGRAVPSKRRVFPPPPLLNLLQRAGNRPPCFFPPTLDGSGILGADLCQGLVDRPFTRDEVLSSYPSPVRSPKALSSPHHN